MAANSNGAEAKFDHSSSGATWADQWDYNEEPVSDGSAAKSKSKLGDYNNKLKSVASTGFEKAKSATSTGLEKAKSVTSTGFEKAKSATSTGAKKAKEGTSAGVRWIKTQYNKKTKNGSGQG